MERDDRAGEETEPTPTGMSRWARAILAIGFSVLITVVIIGYRDQLAQLSRSLPSPWI